MRSGAREVIRWRLAVVWCGGRRRRRSLWGGGAISGETLVGLGESGRGGGRGWEGGSQCAVELGVCRHRCLWGVEKEWVEVELWKNEGMA